MRVVANQTPIINGNDKQNKKQELDKDSQIKLLFSAGIHLTAPSDSKNDSVFKIEALPNSDTIPGGAEWNGACNNSCA